MNATNPWGADIPDPNPVERIGSSLLDRILGNAHTSMVYGDPVQHGDRTVIPVARISTRFGFGGGGGSGASEHGPGSGSGGGGGGTVDAKPIGYIEITPHGTEFHEIQDTTQIALAGMRIGMVVVVLVLLRLLFLRRRKRKDKDKQQAKARDQATLVDSAPKATRRRAKRRVEEAPAPEAPSTPGLARRWLARAS